jgi:[protein-PII] uridylyltransferase
MISNDIINDRTVVDIHTLDRPGLLARIGRIFTEFNLLIQNARIATLGERAEDVFFVTDRQGDPISDPDLCLRLQKHIEKELNELKENSIP